MPKLTLDQKKGYTRLMERMKFNDVPELGGPEEPGKCRACGKQVEEAHPGRFCPSIKTVRFYRDGNVEQITMRGGQDNKNKEGTKLLE